MQTCGPSLNMRGLQKVQEKTWITKNCMDFILHQKKYIFSFYFSMNFWSALIYKNYKEQLNVVDALPHSSGCRVPPGPLTPCSERRCPVLSMTLAFPPSKCHGIQGQNSRNENELHRGLAGLIHQQRRYQMFPGRATVPCDPPVPKAFWWLTLSLL